MKKCLKCGETLGDHDMVCQFCGTVLYLYEQELAAQGPKEEQKQITEEPKKTEEKQNIEEKQKDIVKKEDVSEKASQVSASATVPVTTNSEVKPKPIVTSKPVAAVTTTTAVQDSALASQSKAFVSSMRKLMRAEKILWRVFGILFLVIGIFFVAAIGLGILSTAETYDDYNYGYYNDYDSYNYESSYYETGNYSSAAQKGVNYANIIVLGIYGSFFGFFAIIYLIKASRLNKYIKMLPYDIVYVSQRMGSVRRLICPVLVSNSICLVLAIISFAKMKSSQRCINWIAAQQAKRG